MCPRFVKNSLSGVGVGKSKRLRVKRCGASVVGRDGTGGTTGRRLVVEPFFFEDALLVCGPDEIIGVGGSREAVRRGVRRDIEPMSSALG